MTSPLSCKTLILCSERPEGARWTAFGGPFWVLIAGGIDVTDQLGLTSYRIQRGGFDGHKAVYPVG